MNRCLASANIVPGILKQCALPMGHADLHTWTEALRADGRWMIAMWGADKKVATVEYEEPALASRGAGRVGPTIEERWTQ